jgi:biopolymer transport protein TolR
MSGGHGRKKGRIHKIKKAKLDVVRSEINVTPLVDVCLVLLIIFMVVTPMLARGKEVPLPKTNNHQEENDKNQPIVAIDLAGRLYFDKNQVPDMDTLIKEVQEAWRADDTGTAQGRVFVKADKGAPYIKVYPLLMALHNAAGMTSIDLGTNEIRDDDKE